MRDEELQFDRSCHVLYSKKCRQEIEKRIALHYPPEQRENVFTTVQRQFVDYLKDYRTDLGGKRNFHNGLGGTYDCIAVFSYYVVCHEVTSFAEIEQMYGDIFLGAFEKLSFVDCNKSFFKKLMYQAFASSAKKCTRWNDYDMEVEPYRAGEPIRYRFTACPVAEFAREHELLDILPALCNADYAAMELIHAKLVRTTTLGTGDYCDYTICGDRDPYLREHPEYRDELGGRWNR